MVLAISLASFPQVIASLHTVLAILVALDKAKGYPRLQA